MRDRPPPPLSQAVFTVGQPKPQTPRWALEASRLSNQSKVQREDPLSNTSRDAAFRSVSARPAGRQDSTDEVVRFDPRRSSHPTVLEHRHFTMPAGRLRSEFITNG
jgi:hypothetical protein